MKSKAKFTIPIGLLILLFLYWTAAKVSEANFACGYCHKEQNERWKQSTHKSVHCKDCHIEPGISGELDAQLNGVKNLFVAVTKGVHIQPHEKPLPISTENCRSCHAAILYVNEIGYNDLPDNSLRGQSLQISHRAHVEKYTIDCVECHRGVVHNDPEKIGKYKTNWPFMHNDCGVCHDGKYWERFKIEVTDLEDQGKCNVCHPTYEPPPNYDAEEY